MKIYGNCPVCGESITKPQRKTCSAECGRSLITKPHSFCLFCGEKTKRATTKYCSAKCRAQHFSQQGLHFGGPFRKVPNKICEYCSKEFWGQTNKRYQKGKFCSRKCTGLYRRDNWKTDEFASLKKLLENREFSEETRAKLSKINKGKKKSKETRAKLSKVASERDPSRNWCIGKVGYRGDLGHFVRSRWEANVARILKEIGVSYIYEKKHFKLTKSDDSTTYYTPDFQINSWFFEVKGWWTPIAKEKFVLMKEQYPEVRIYVIDEKEYHLIENESHSLIQGWEYDGRIRKETNEDGD